MEAFKTLTAVAVPFDLSNIDTDRIIPARFLRNPRSVGLEKFLFHDLRFDADGKEKPDFILNQAPYRNARIVVAASNFAIGSSREAAVWAIAGYGIRALIASSFGDIFSENCFKNGVLTVILPPEPLSALRKSIHALPGTATTVDLEAQRITGPDGTRYEFEIDPFRKHCLLSGQEEIDLTTALDAEITAFERRRRVEMPWLG